MSARIIVTVLITARSCEGTDAAVTKGTKATLIHLDPGSVNVKRFALTLRGLSTVLVRMGNMGMEEIKNGKGCNVFNDQYQFPVIKVALDRPTMREVAMELEVLRKHSWTHESVNEESVGLTYATGSVDFYTAPISPYNSTGEFSGAMQFGQ